MRRIRLGTPPLAPFRTVPLLAALILAPAAHAGQLVLSPANYDFGTVAVLAPAVVGTILVINHGTPTTLFAIETGAGCGDFTAQLPAAPVTLADRETLAITITYDPVGRGVDACSFELVDDNGVTDVFGMFGQSVAPKLYVAETALSFATQDWQSGVPETLLVVVENVGNATMQAGNFSGSFHTGSGHFQLGPVPLPIAPGQLGYLPVVFDPASPGTKNETLTLALDNDPPQEQNYRIALEGTWTGDLTAVGDAAAAAPKLRIGPSPSRGSVDLACDVPRAGSVIAEVRDLAGRLVARSETFAAAAGPRTLTLRRGRDWAPAPGVYLVRVRLDGAVLGHGRVVVVR